MFTASCVPQDNWYKAWAPSLDFVLEMQQGALHLLATMGRAAGTKRLSIWALKPVEHLHLPEDMRELTSKLVPEQGTKATTEALRGTCARIARRRYRTWVLLHPHQFDVGNPIVSGEILGVRNPIAVGLSTTVGNPIVQCV